ncbi:Hermansky-Pudlak syndrome 3 protein [Biomphalaria pfeifferi]|uniref:Hermansky-Pudlak syndrome 3 protein n=1 Tax=Biomphalaria pfeifferi TaxID=112525 RepID=A0AAD8FDU7_BIOPF|nr:Hermansky-Pudlak syndrome 3 protein [Biomphalaria pfeifferi]
MVRVFKCHSFASQGVIPVSKEPLALYAENDLVFIATRDCEIIVFQIKDGTFQEIQRCPTISEVDTLLYNSFKKYIVTTELKKSWKHETKSVYVYLNWNRYNKEKGKPRTKVNLAGRSHIQHSATPVYSDIMEIIELPMDGNATCMAVCKYTGNFAVACRTQVKLCSIIEKTVANSDKTYLDVEVFLELCWNFPIKALSVCEEFIVCCSHKEVQGIRVRYENGRKANSRSQNKLISPRQSYADDLKTNWDNLDFGTPQFYVGETFSLQGQLGDRMTSLRFSSDDEDLGRNYQPSSKDFSTIGMKPSVHQSPRTVMLTESETSKIMCVDDTDFVAWTFSQNEEEAVSNTVCLPGLHSAITQSLCPHQTHTISPPILSDFSGGNVKSSSGLKAETILHICDSREKEDWINVTLVPMYRNESSAPVGETSTDRMRSSQRMNRTCVCCYISGTRGGYLYRIHPTLMQVSSYKYTDQALQVSVYQSHLHVATVTGIETYTSRWGVVAHEVCQKNEHSDAPSQQIYPPSSLDICLCGHEPFVGAVNLSVGRNFLALLSKVYDSTGKEESHWSVYVLHMHSLVDQYREMICFAEGIERTGPSSYIHLLQEAHLLLSTNWEAQYESGYSEVKHCLRQVNRLLGDYYVQPDQEDWFLCCPYYKNSGASLQDLVMDAVARTSQTGQNKFGQGLLDYLDSIIFASDDFVNVSVQTGNAILYIYFTSAPEKFSKVLLLSNLKSYTTETAYKYLKTCLVNKCNSLQLDSALDKLAMVQLQLELCDVESACSQLRSIHKPSLIEICSSHLSLMCEDMSTFSPLAQLMRQHMASTLLEILVEMLDKCAISLDSLLSLVNSQSEQSYNSQTREVLELILTDSKRVFLFEEAVFLLCKIYMSKLLDTAKLSTSRQITISGQQKFSLPQGDGYFAQRFACLDYLPPFYNPERMSRPCAKLEIKQILGQGSRTAAVPITFVTKQATNERCHCCCCNDTLLKLQSLLCSPRLSTDLATFVLAKLEDPRTNAPAITSTDLECLESIHLLCLAKLDLEKATEQIVDKYPFIAASFASCCFKGSLDRYTYLLRYMESRLKQFVVQSGGTQEEMLMKSYKDLLSTLTETFTPSQFLDLLPADGNIFFLLPFICSSLKWEHVNKLRRKIIDMGTSLLSQMS